MKRKSIYIGMFTFAVLLVAAEAAFANAPTNNLSSTIINTYRNAAALWLPQIRTYAIRLFSLLAVLDLTYMGIVLILKSGNLYDFAFNLVRKILFFGFFFAVLLNGGAWMNAIINSFRTIAANVPGGAATITPGAILEESFDVFMDACSLVAVLNPSSWLIGLMGIGVVVFGALMTGVQIIALCEMYIAIIMGQILLGFGGSDWSKDYAISFVKYVIAVGLKLMAIQLIAAIANNMFTAWANIPPAQFTLSEVAALAVAMLLLFFIMKSIPETISSILSGGQFGSNPVSVLGSAAAVGAAALAGGVGMAAGAMGGGAKSMAVLREAVKATSSSGVRGAAKSAASAGIRTFMDNLDKPAAFKSPMVGGMAANMRADRQAASAPRVSNSTKSETNNLDNSE